MSGIIGMSPNMKSGVIGKGGSGFVTVARVDIAATTPAWNDLFSVTTDPDSIYKFLLSGVNASSGTSGYSIYVKASIDGGSNWLEADWSMEFTYGPGDQNTGRWNMHSTANTTGIGLDHNHQVGVGNSGEFTVSTNATTSGQAKGWGHTVYDSDNQGDFGNSHIGGHWNTSSLANINLIRFSSNHSSFTPNSGYITALKLV